MATLNDTVSKRGKIPRSLIMRRWLYARLTAFPKFSALGQSNWKDDSLIYYRASLFGVYPTTIKHVSKEMGVFDSLKSGDTVWNWKEPFPFVFVGRTNGIVASEVRRGLQDLYIRYPRKIPYSEWKRLQENLCCLTVFKKIAYDLGFREAGCKDGLIDSWPSFFLDVVDYRKKLLLPFFLKKPGVWFSIYSIARQQYCQTSKSKSAHLDRLETTDQYRSDFIGQVNQEIKSLDSMIVDSAIAELCKEGFLTCMKRKVVNSRYEAPEDWREGQTIEYYSINSMKVGRTPPEDMYYNRIGFDYYRWKKLFYGS